MTRVMIKAITTAMITIVVVMVMMMVIIIFIVSHSSVCVRPSSMRRARKRQNAWPIYSFICIESTQLHSNRVVINTCEKSGPQNSPCSPSVHAEITEEGYRQEA